MKLVAFWKWIPAEFKFKYITMACVSVETGAASIWFTTDNTTLNNDTKSNIFKRKKV